MSDSAEVCGEAYMRVQHALAEMHSELLICFFFKEESLYVAGPQNIDIPRLCCLLREMADQFDEQSLEIDSARLN